MEGGEAKRDPGERCPTPPHKRTKRAEHAERAEEEALVMRRVTSPLADGPPLDLHRKLCRRFSTQQGCPYGNSCRFIHLPGREHSSSRLINKSKACARFSSASGCPYGERCHFSHCLPIGSTAVLTTDLGNLPPASNADRCTGSPATRGKGESEHKTKLCNWFGSAHGCRFGEMCRFAHGEGEMQKALQGEITRDTARVSSPAESGKLEKCPSDSGVERRDSPEKKGGSELTHAYEPVALRRHHVKRSGVDSFGISTKARMSIDASLAGPIIGTSGMHTKYVHRLTGATVLIRDHESDQSLRVVEVEGSFEQVKQASVMIKDLLLHVLQRPPRFYTHNLKSKVCTKFPAGLCRFGSGCRFVHAAAQEDACQPSSTAS